MKVNLVFPKLPPALDGIGDYTARLATEIAGRGQIKILTAQDGATPLPGVATHQAFSIDQRHGVRGLADAVAADPPDWLVVQYNPFSYGHWGWNPHLPRVLRTIKRQNPAVRIALMVHEASAPLHNWRLALMNTWQLPQLWLTGQQADLLFVAVEPWLAPFRRWFGTTPVYHLPVGSNMPYQPMSRQAARQALGLSEQTFVLGVFGMARPSRLLGFVRETATAIRHETDDILVLYVGPDGAQIRALLGDLPLHDAGRVPPEAASQHFTAMDVYLAPFKWGVTTRRGSFMVALQHGIATVSTHGSHTDPMLHKAHDEAFLMAPDDDPIAYRRYAEDLFHNPDRRAEIAKAGQALYQHSFDWNVIAERFWETLAAQ